MNWVGRVLTCFVLAGGSILVRCDTLKQKALSHSEECPCIEEVAAPFGTTTAIKWENCWAYCMQQTNCYVFSHNVSPIKQLFSNRGEAAHRESCEQNRFTAKNTKNYSESLRVRILENL